MYLLTITRDLLLRLLPQGGVVAEIGVAKGEFSKIILQQAQPRCLHLIDPWRHQDDDEYRQDVNNVAQGEADRRYQEVVQAFAPEVASGRVVLHRTFSVEAAATFADKTFDWVYVDARHTQDAVLEDLQAWAPKVKKGGFILGHDYCNHAMALAQGFGVIEAVNDFIAQSGCPMLFLTAEHWPTYMIAKEPEGAAAQRALGIALKHVDTVIEIRGPVPTGYQLQIASFGDGTHKLVPSFGPDVSP